VTCGGRIRTLSEGRLLIEVDGEVSMSSRSADNTGMREKRIRAVITEWFTAKRTLKADWGAVDRTRRRMMYLLQDPTIMKGHHVDEAGVGVHGQEIEAGIDIANHEMTVKATGAIEIMIETDIGTVAMTVKTEVEKGIGMDGTIMIAGQGDKEGLVDGETHHSSATLTSTGVLRRTTIDGKRSALLCYAKASANFNTE
jgi:hypothetical protein